MAFIILKAADKDIKKSLLLKGGIFIKAPLNSPVDFCFTHSLSADGLGAC
jgi:hypothetical protein